MRMLWVVIILIVTALLSVPFVLERYPGKYFLSFNDLKTLDNKTIVTRYQASYRRLLHTTKSELNEKNINIPINERSATKSVYRWKDKYGNWQFSDTAPEGIESEVIEVVDKINTMNMNEVPMKGAE